jgi:lipoprotein NlpD
MFVSWRRTIVWSVFFGAGLVLAGCGTQSASRAPVEDRTSARLPGVGMDPNTQAVKQPPGFENAGKAGYYTVKPGETLIRIGLDTGQNWKDIARWNNLERPNQIEVGQVLRVVPPTVAAATTSSSSSSSPVSAGAVTATAGVVTRPIASSAAASASAAASQATKPAAATSASEGAATGEDQLAWAWPVNGPVIAGFDEVKNKGVDLGGSAGDAVLAAADGRVVYVGAGLRGYGNLIILKHNSTYLTAYAHNQSLLVKEDQAVRKGQKIAEMGNSDADRVKLHFEVRRQGKPVDPIRYLPTR